MLANTGEMKSGFIVCNMNIPLHLPEVRQLNNIRYSDYY